MACLVSGEAFVPDLQTVTSSLPPVKREIRVPFGILNFVIKELRMGLKPSPKTVLLELKRKISAPELPEKRTEGEGEKSLAVELNLPGGQPHCRQAAMAGRRASQKRRERYASE